MEVACPTPLMASSVLPSPPCAATSLSSCNSIFFSNGGRALSTRSRVGLVSSRRRAPPSAPFSRRRHGECRCLFGLGVPELVVIAGVAALVFGPKKLPEIGRSIGKTVKSFQQAAKEFETELKKEPDETAEPKTVASEDDSKELEASGRKDTA